MGPPFYFPPSPHYGGVASLRLSVFAILTYAGANTRPDAASDDAMLIPLTPFSRGDQRSVHTISTSPALRCSARGV